MARVGRPWFILARKGLGLWPLRWGGQPFAIGKPAVRPRVVDIREHTSPCLCSESPWDPDKAFPPPQISEFLSGGTRECLLRKRGTFSGAEILLITELQTS